MGSSAPDAGVHRLELPTGFAVGPVNCWLIDDDPLTLVDTGPNSGTVLHALERALAEHGRRVEDLGRIVVSHQHMDHLGLAGVLAERSGAEVCAYAPLAPWLAEWDAAMEAEDRFAEDLMARHGIPAEVRYALRSMSRVMRGWGAPVTVTRPLRDGDELPFAGRTLHVHHRPGHSPSDLVLHDPRRGLLIGADHLIAHISSNPLAARRLDGSGERFPALATYLDSLRATREMDLALVLTGHGEPVADHRALIDERFAGHRRRAGKIVRLLAERPATAYELAHALWGNVAITQAFLTLSEVLGHTDLLVAEGRLREETDAEGVTRWVSVR
ncbi:MAG: MBL fold metallo-hydrolase [Solirubrobacteraceae bacterium]|nr:MBL fold metallo-hydrolase [Solirubrobacteraceae bacterium]